MTRVLGLVACAAALVATGAVAAPSVHDVIGDTVFLPVTGEPPPALYVDPPIPERLADDVAIIPYRTEHFRVLAVFGEAGLGLSPRAGHLHVTVDDAPWHWADAGDNHAIVVAGLPPGPHKVLIELADPTHRVITGKAVTFVIPATAGHAH